MNSFLVSRVTFRINVPASGATFVEVAKRGRAEPGDDMHHLPTLREAARQLEAQFQSQRAQHGRLHPMHVKLTEEDLASLDD